MTYSRLFSETTRSIKDIPSTFVIKKFFELGYYAQYNPSSRNYSCSCPICLEGSTGIGKIRRCFYLEDRNIIYCHHCGWSSRPLKWISQVSGRSNAEIYKEIKTGEYDYIDLSPRKVNDFNFNEIITDLTDNSLPISPINLSDANECSYYKDNIDIQSVLHYIKSRRLDKACNKPKAWYTSLKDKIHHNRLVIPYYDESNNKVTFYQSRDINGSSNIRYLSKSNGIKSVFNLGNIDYSLDKYFIFEGPFDSCFTKNGVAIGGINTGRGKFSGIQEEQLDKILLLDRIWVLDSQYLDQASRTKSESLLRDNESIFLWPKDLGQQYKDFNELCLACNLNEITHDFILKNTVSGFAGILQLQKI